MYRIYYKLILLAGLVFVLASCTKDLDTVPLDPKVETSANVFDNPAAYKEALAKIYAGLAVSGQEGPSGMPDISGIDEGFGQYLRGLWYLEELPTDEAVISWNDQTIKDFHNQSWTSSDVFISAFYYRIFYQIGLCNEFLRQTTDEKLNERGVDDALRADIKHYRAEARFMRALSYYHALDEFGSVPFVTENDPVGAFFPKQISRTDLFNYIESELKAIEPDLIDARQNEYGRADKAADWTLLAKLYLNAKVFTGQERNTDCITYCKKVIDAGYSLDPEYANLFLADNNVNNPEVIFSINFDGVHTKTWGGTTFIIHAAVGGNMNPADYGIDGGWAGTRTTSALVEKFGTSVAPIISPKQLKETRATYPVLHVPGSYQGWDPGNDSTVVASVNSDGNYEGYLYFKDAGTEFKFVQGTTWTDPNWGDDGADGTLDPGGANIKVADAGYYKIDVDMNNLTYTAVKTTWGVIGDATPGGWTTDQDMTFDPSTGTWSVTVDLVKGSLKFRANHDWTINYGDNGADGILDAGGDNIQIPEAGTYVITLKLGVPDYTYSIVRKAFDHRAMFFTDGQSLEINDVGKFTDGYAVTKFKNITSTGQPGSDPTFVDTDFPLFRLADVYLMYAEAVVRGGSGGDITTAVNYINKLRERAYGDNSGDITADQLTLPFILDERARELYWEAQRRTDLIRFGEFTGGNYLWPWKGGVKEGTATDSHYDLYPIPASDITANPTLVQNPGY
ncbi:RagB/SusD family nutrient uptake outer membrane protein [Candidatus Sulfidibacterium hydrothermale]|nr:RagB/SusD family nutrient uptake outer membrane protein [Candidatus Sulfidibacterium hydrothermale]UBM62827.1 RagB/SusD family nutrient uptake outer membrane protein [Candidatus Sulfidibacterium hydrothermale]